MLEGLQPYADKALSPDNRKPFDGDSNCPFRIVISMAEVGTYGDEEGGFWCEGKIPRQVDNCLGGSVVVQTNQKEEAIQMLEELIEKLKQ